MLCLAGAHAVQCLQALGVEPGQPGVFLVRGPVGAGAEPPDLSIREALEPGPEADGPRMRRGRMFMNKAAKAHTHQHNNERSHHCEHEVGCTPSRGFGLKAPWDGMSAHHGVPGNREVCARDPRVPPPHPLVLCQEQEPLDDTERRDVPHFVRGKVDVGSHPQPLAGHGLAERRAGSTADLHEVEGLDQDPLRAGGRAPAVGLQGVRFLAEPVEAELCGPVAVYTSISTSAFAVPPELAHHRRRNCRSRGPFGEGRGVRSDNAFGPAGCKVRNHERGEHGQRLELGPHGMRQAEHHALFGRDLAHEGERVREQREHRAPI